MGIGSDMIDYHQTLDIVEKFMVNSGIRNFCVYICKGACCGDCQDTNSETCSKNEGRRLACSLFVCADLLYKIDHCVDKDKIMKLVKLRKYITDYIYPKKFGVYRVFFSTPPKEIFSNFSISKNKLSILEDKKFITEIKNSIKGISNWEKIREGL